jgi:rhomboid protease GluP
MGSYSPNPLSSQQEPVFRGSGPQPEVLPPDYGSMAPQQPVRKSRSAWSVSPATHLLVGVNCLVFLFMLLRGVSFWAPTSDQLMYFGADQAGRVLIGGEWVRIVTAMFVHVGIIHLATNMWCLWNLGMLAEPLVGSMGLLAAYILCGAAGNLLSTCVNWFWFYSEWNKYHDLGVFPGGAGASGAVFGLAGLLIVLLKSPRLPVPPPELRKLRKSVIYFAAINFIIGIGTLAPGLGVRIDNMAHLGGFSCGLLFAAPLVPRLGSPRRLFVVRRRISVGMVVALLVLFGFFLAQLPG